MSGRGLQEQSRSGPIVKYDTDHAPGDAQTAASNVAPGSALSNYWELDVADKRGTFHYSAYRPSFFLPVQWTKSIDQFPMSPTRGVATKLPVYQHVEGELQLSMRSKLLENILLPGADLWLAYTQQSMWQMWNGTQSSPFRETDYQPELIYVVPVPTSWQHGPRGWRWRMVQLAVVHQSNGQPDPLSRSWNRAYGEIGLEHDSLIANFRFEQRLDAGGQQDDNPDIVHYLGRSEMQVGWRPGQSTASMVWRPAPGGRGSVQLHWTYPVNAERPDGPRWYLQVFQGFGETLQDYNFRQTSIGLGFTIFKL